MTRARVAAAAAAGVLATVVVATAAVRNWPPSVVQFVFTSDAHYGLFRATFRGASHVNAAVVNQALVEAINALPSGRFPDDDGVKAGQMVGGLDFVIEGGDVANREESDGGLVIQPAALSWTEFLHDYAEQLHTTDKSGGRTLLLVVPGNHEASNAVGFYKPMVPPVDDTALVGIYNRMLLPPTPLDRASFDYGHDKVFFTRDLRGLHFEFLQVWPDSSMRRRMDEDLRNVPHDIPVIIVAHDQPDVEGKHFINPNGAHDINAVDQFENLLVDRFADGSSKDLPSLREQSDLEAFLVAHPNVTAYLHGNSNWHQVYEWNGPGRRARLHVVRADSPMKGAVSSRDETRLSFEVVTVDPAHRTMTVRECLWNAKGASTTGLAWGDSATFALVPSL